MLKAYKFRLYPDNSQRIALARSFGCARWFWNYALNLCQQTYQDTGKGLSRGAIQGLLPNLKNVYWATPKHFSKEYEWLCDCYSQCLQFVALNLSTAFKNFFDNRAKSPRFKSKRGRQTVTIPQNFKIEGDDLKLPGKVGKVYCRQHRPIEGELRSVTVSMNPDGKYYASILVEDGIEQPEPKAVGAASPQDLGKAIGIDLGLNHFAITSEGSKYENPRHIAEHAKNLKRKQQSLSRKHKGSQNRNKARIQVAKVQAKIARCRSDFLHKLSRKIVNENSVLVLGRRFRARKHRPEGQVIVVENLNVKGMVKNQNLAKAISDCGWGMFTTMLTYKAEWAGKTMIEIDRWFPSSKLCHVCKLTPV